MLNAGLWVGALLGCLVGLGVYRVRALRSAILRFLNRLAFNAIPKNISGRSFQALKHLIEILSSHASTSNFGFQDRQVDAPVMTLIGSTNEKLGNHPVGGFASSRTSARSIPMCAFGHILQPASTRAGRQAPEVLGPFREAPNQKHRRAA